MPPQESTRQRVYVWAGFIEDGVISFNTRARRELGSDCLARASNEGIHKLWEYFCRHPGETFSIEQLWEVTFPHDARAEFSKVEQTKKDNIIRKNCSVLRQWANGPKNTAHHKSDEALLRTDYPTGSRRAHGYYLNTTNLEKYTPTEYNENKLLVERLASAALREDCLFATNQLVRTPLRTTHSQHLGARTLPVSVFGACPLDVVLIPGGAFQIGSTGIHRQLAPNQLTPELEGLLKTALSPPLEREGTHLTIPPYVIGRFPITNEQYGCFLDAHPEYPKPKELQKDRNTLNYRGPRSFEERRDHRTHAPVVGITWHDAKRFCEWLSLRLPSEAEWEFAAHGGRPLLYPWGNVAPTPGHAIFGGVPGEPKRAEDARCIAGQSPFGVWDLAGNVWELCENQLDSYASWTDGQYPPSTTRRSRVRRGGSWDTEWRDLRTTYRGGADVDESNPYDGFRVAASLDDRLLCRLFKLDPAFLTRSRPALDQVLAQLGGIGEIQQFWTHLSAVNDGVTRQVFSERALLPPIPPISMLNAALQEWLQDHDRQHGTLKWLDIHAEMTDPVSSALQLGQPLYLNHTSWRRVTGPGLLVLTTSRYVEYLPSLREVEELVEWFRHAGWKTSPALNQLLTQWASEGSPDEE